MYVFMDITWDAFQSQTTARSSTFGVGSSELRCLWALGVGEWEAQHRQA